MKVTYWGTYDRAYPRNLTVIAGLRANGAEVAECHSALWEGTSDKLSRAGSGWLSPGLLLRWAWAYARLSVRFMAAPRPDILFVGYSGHFDMFPAALLARLRGIPVVFDAFLSLYEAFVVDRATIKPGSIKARILFALDKYSCRLADLVLLDTDSHIDYFCSEFGLPRGKFRRSFVGTLREPPAGAHPSAVRFTVLYSGRYIPLHGVGCILRAAAALKDREDIHFVMDGTGEELPAARRLASELGLTNVEFRNSATQEDISAAIAASDISLGIFGATEKAARVIPNKVFEALALGRALITGHSPAAAELLTDGEDCLLTPMNDPAKLADAILRMKDDPALRLRTGENGRRTFERLASARVIGRDILASLRDLEVE